jgi:hypothetical protein
MRLSWKVGQETSERDSLRDALGPASHRLGADFFQQRGPFESQTKSEGLVDCAGTVILGPTRGRLIEPDQRSIKPADVDLAKAEAPLARALCRADSRSGWKLDAQAGPAARIDFILAFASMTFSAIKAGLIVAHPKRVTDMVTLSPLNSSG